MTSNLPYIFRDFRRDLHALGARLSYQTLAQLPNLSNHLITSLQNFVLSMDTVPSSLFPKALLTQGCYAERIFTETLEIIEGE